EKSKKLYGKNLNYTQYLLANHYVEFLREQNQDKINLEKVVLDSYFEIESIHLFEHIDNKIINMLPVSPRIKSILLWFKADALDYNSNYKDISVYIHNFSLKSRKIKFSFSEESYGINIDALVLIRESQSQHNKANNIGYKATYILGEEIKDFSENMYSIKLPFKYMIKDFEFQIIDEENKLITYVKSKSIIKRIFNRKIVSKFKNMNSYRNITGKV
ncbi:hypothetical protein BU065_13110, partial [Staphylococcus succinus]|uniref:hypothetical protein n=1 Tax=Staphylococcus succinus TaxID=61015 RepID=UPI000FF1D4C1